MPHGGNSWLISILFTFLRSFHKGVAAVIQTQPTVLAAIGEDAPLSCQLSETKDVQQVTWQKDLGNTEKNIGSYSQFYGKTVNADFKDKVQFAEVGSQKNSIVVRNVTEKDGGCYFCSFNTYPDGASTGRTCSNVYELHEPVLNVRRSNSPAESVVSCSATGRPAPTVTSTVLQQNLSFSHYNTTRVTNTNGTVTVTTTASSSASSSTQVGCSVSVFSAAPRESSVTVPGLTETSDDGLDAESGSYYIIGSMVVAGLVMLVCVAAASLSTIKHVMRKCNNTSDIKCYNIEDATERSQEPEEASHTSSPELNDGLDISSQTLVGSNSNPEDTEKTLDISSQVEEPPVEERKIPSTYKSTLSTDCRNSTRQLSEKLDGSLNLDHLKHGLNKLITHQSVGEEMQEPSQKSKVE